VTRVFLFVVICAGALTAAKPVCAQKPVCIPNDPVHPTGSLCYGGVQGTISYYENQGNYCTTTGGHSCADTLYVAADYHILRPMKNVKVYVRDADTDEVIATTVTNESGKFNTSWLSNHVPAHMNLHMRYEHKDGRFNIRTTTGGAWISWTSGKATNLTGDMIMNMSLGNEAAPSKLANLYAGAEFMWSSLEDSGIMRADFNNLEVRAFYANQQPATSQGRACDSSCTADGRLYVNTNDAFRPQSRIWHEMGHVASGLAKPRARSEDFGFVPMFGWDAYAQDTSPGWAAGALPGWSKDSPEWYAPGFEEAYATFLGDRANYRKTAPQPLTCSTNLVCENVLWNQTETSRGSMANCVVYEWRMPISAMRFLRDVYDDSPNGDGTEVTFGGMLRTIRSFPAGTGDHQASESGKDGFNAADFRFRVDASEGVSTASLLENNCKPYIN